MENQHRKITGYRELTQDEIDLMNKIKAKGAELAELIEEVKNVNKSHDDQLLVSQSEAQRWAAEARTDFQKGTMSLTRAVAKPTFF
jgi:hypothetical protein